MGPFPASFSYFCWSLDSNRGPLESETTALPTEPQALVRLLQATIGSLPNPKPESIKLHIPITDGIRRKNRDCSTLKTRQLCILESANDEKFRTLESWFHFAATITEPSNLFGIDRHQNARFRCLFKFAHGQICTIICACAKSSE